MLVVGSSHTFEDDGGIKQNGVVRDLTNVDSVVCRLFRPDGSEIDITATVTNAKAAKWKATVPATGANKFNVPGNWELRVITTEGADVQISEPYQFHVARAGR